MKSILLLVLVLAFTVLGNAQTAPEQIAQLNMLSNQGMVCVQGTAETPLGGSVVRLTGPIKIETGAVRVTADEVDVNQATGEIELRGAIHMLTRSLPGSCHR